ncbi:HEPN domain-containing protein [Xanthomonas sp. LMG 8989]|uniref:HEPN domain-containing protein n=1 Tax=Xanthomonas sp. LMG 8989 TaxID=1591156 RepID=UPI0034E0D290
MYDSQRRKADLIVSHASKIRSAALREDKAALLHAALAAHVAAWDAYVKAVVAHKYSVVSDPTALGYSVLRAIAEERMKASAKKLNTPNSENTRTFMMESSQFDPWPSWTNVTFGKDIITSSLNVRERINEIFHVRHSFSHGFPMPAYTWNQDSSGATALNSTSLRSVSSFFESIVSKTDVAYSIHIATTFAISRPW